MDIPKINITKSSDIAFRDPLSEETRKIRTHLLFISALAILVKTYDLKITKAPWLDLDVPANAPQILEGALSVTICYLLFVFLLYFWQDFRRWQLAGEIHIINGSFDLILHSRDDLFAISQHLDKLTADQPLQDTIRTAVESAAIRLPESQAKLVSVSSSLRRLNCLQWFRVTFIEAALPITLGIFGLYKISTALLPFICAIMN